MQTVKNRRVFKKVVDANEAKEISDAENLIVYKMHFSAQKTKNPSKIVYKTHFFS